MMAVPLALALLQSSRALVLAPAARRWRATHHGYPVDSKLRRRCTAVRAASSPDDASRKKTALLWLSPNRLRVRDNLALTRAAELGRDGLAICLAWPHNTSAASSIDNFTPVEAFGLAAARALDASLGELGQQLLFLQSHEADRDPVSIIADAGQQIQPAHVVNMSGDAANSTPNVVEVIDDGTLVPFQQAHKALGRSRKGGRALRWTTFLGNVMKRMQEEGFLDEERTWSISDLPPPLHGTDGMFATIPEASSCPMWAQQLLSDWGEVSEEKAIRRVCGSASTSGTNDASPLTERGSKDTKLSPYLRYGVISPQRAAKAGVRVRDLLWREEEAIIRASNTASTSVTTGPADSSPLTEKGSKDTKLSPYLRYGVISPQRAAEAGVRVRDLLWRDWSHICYGLTRPIRRGEAVLEFLDGARCPLSHELGVEEEDLFCLWCVGNTGSKVVDAGMRQLWKEGWMPRKMRILSAACLVEGLGIDWRRGRDWFGETLIDHDPAINELMWQNAGMCGVDPFYTRVKWEASPGSEGEDGAYEYVERWHNEELVWPSYLKPYAEREPPKEIVERANSQREALQKKGVYKAARTVANSGVRVAWPGLDPSGIVEEGEVMGVGLTPVDELRIRAQ